VELKNSSSACDERIDDEIINKQCAQSTCFLSLNYCLIVGTAEIAESLIIPFDASSLSALRRVNAQSQSLIGIAVEKENHFLSSRISVRLSSNPSIRNQKCVKLNMKSNDAKKKNAIFPHHM